ncbi:MAG: hypothetical protein IK111_08745 [Lachnospiraceae bacterium]|nr:hypothetical protein [Lachnospiraceae bacterium]
MSRFKCDGSYKDDMNEYTEAVFDKYGASSRSAEREVMILADEGNTVALKLYADMIFYKKILRKNAYRDAFALYMESAGLSASEDGTLNISERAYPLSYWPIAFCLVNYRRGSFLIKSETIDLIDKMTLAERLSMALELAVASLQYAVIPGALNLIGLILYEVSGNEDLYKEIKDVIEENIPIKSSLADMAEEYFKEAAQKGYVYAANNLAAREADRISKLTDDTAEEDLKEAVNRYIGYLKISADRYEPYAANRLGLFYMTGEIKGKGGTTYHKAYTDTALAKEYFNKATVCPDVNSAWAFFNLIKYFHKDYDNDIEHMNEHMDYIKELNPEVYGLAMEL